MEGGKIIASFSGGKTSAFMTFYLKEKYRGGLVVLFANTGQEHEKTLNFVNDCDKAWGLNVVWLEAKVNPQKRAGTKFSVVSYETASRNGEPFEAVIKKYGLPNTSYPHCTRELKLSPINAWVKDNIKEPYKMAVGIRADEVDRMQQDAEQKKIIYPLVSMFPADVNMVNRFWEAQEFTLDLPPILGNCTWCWKKTLRKHLTLIKSNPEIYDFPARMEANHKTTNSLHGERLFFRGNKSVEDLVKLSKTAFVPWTESYQGELFQEFDVAGGCVEGCEVEF